VTSPKGTDLDASEPKPMLVVRPKKAGGSERSAFKVLFVYPNFQMSNLLLPAGVSILSAVLKQAGFQVRLFDTTLYRPEGKSFDEVRLDMLQLKTFRLEDREIHIKTSDMAEDFRTLLDEYQPNLVAASVLQDTYPLCRDLLAEAHARGIPVLVGGIWPTFVPQGAMKDPFVDLICRGEGEHLIVELCDRMARRRPYDDIPNLGYRGPDGELVLNPLGPTVNVDELPFSDYSIFEPDRFYRSMQGRVMRIIPVEMHRGCPYQCAFCEDPSLNVIYKGISNYHRAKRPRRLIDEIHYFIETFGAEYIYFNAETFFAMPARDFDVMAELYAKEIHLPFWLQTRPETITEDRIAKLKYMGVANINVGLEHGNEEFRARVLKRSMKNERIVSGLSILERHDIPVTVNNIMGFPDETRDLIFDTIELNRSVTSATINAYLYNPYEGTELYEVCKAKGYLPADTDEKVVDIALSEEFPYFKTILNMPQITKEELIGMQRTFVLYVKLPRSEWPKIRLAERLDEEGNRAFAELRARYLGAPAGHNEFEIAPAPATPVLPS
jgi:radical SAM superfamily enzyme